MNTNTIEKVKKWFHDKGIIENSNILKQLEKTQEELTETRDAAVKMQYFDNEHDQYDARIDLVDGIGDILVTLIGVCEMSGLTLDACLEQAWSEIKDRTGKMENGKFTKNK